MCSPQEGTVRTIGLLLECSSSRERSGVLLEGLVGTGLCLSAALWRQVGRGTVRAWHPILARGSASSLPTLNDLRGVVDGNLSRELSQGKHIVLPIGHTDFALLLAADPLNGAHSQIADDVEALFHVWLTIEQADGNSPNDHLLDALPGIQANWNSSAASPALGRTEKTTEGLRAGDLRTFLEREAAWLLCPSIKLDLSIKDLSPLTANPLQLEACLRELLASATTKNTPRPKQVHVSIAPAAPTAPGALIVVESEPTASPQGSTNNPPTGCNRLFTAARLIHSLKGDFQIGHTAQGGTRIVAWLPERCA